MSDIKLKPCPFCGQSLAEFTEAKELQDCAYFDNCYKPDCTMVAIICDAQKGGCGASTGYCKDYDDAVEKWNGRADNA